MVTSDASGVPLAGTLPLAGSYGPDQFHTAYALPTQAPTTQTIAIVVAYEAPNIENDLNVYSKQYGLPPCTVANGCLKIVDMCGGKSRKARSQCFTDQTWSLEASMDVEVAHAICQNCKIVLVESAYSDWANMANAENAAAQNGATVISNSWGGTETSGGSQYDAAWNHPGVPVVFASGDGNYGVSYPASAPTVVAAGGTTLTLNPDNSYNNERVWSGTSGGTGSGCSSIESANSWQTSMQNWGQTGCGSRRGVVDVAADADPATGAAVYDSFGYNGTTGWYQVGGTSLSAPIIAGTFALAGGGGGVPNAQSVPYGQASSSTFHDITSGSNGSCGTSMCTAGAGYDGPTGLGTPNGIGGF